MCARRCVCELLKRVSVCRVLEYVAGPTSVELAGQRRGGAYEAPPPSPSYDQRPRGY